MINISQQQSVFSPTHPFDVCVHANVCVCMCISVLCCAVCVLCSTVCECVRACVRMHMYTQLCACACVHKCACVCARLRACMHALRTVSTDKTLGFINTLNIIIATQQVLVEAREARHGSTTRCPSLNARLCSSNRGRNCWRSSSASSTSSMSRRPCCVTSSAPSTPGPVTTATRQLGR